MRWESTFLNKDYCINFPVSSIQYDGNLPIPCIIEFSYKQSLIPLPRLSPLNLGFITYTSLSSTLCSFLTYALSRRKSTCVEAARAAAGLLAS